VTVTRRAFVLRQTRLQDVAGVPGIRLYLADAVLPLWHAVQGELADPDAPLPYWAFAWAGGLALASYLRDRPEAVLGRRVFDLGTGSGLVAIAAAQAGAATVAASDIDPFAAAAVELNARANHVRIAFVGRDVLDEPPPDDVEVLLAGDTWYEGPLAERVLPWLVAAHDAGIEVLVGDPGRRYLPDEALVELATYEVRTTTELEDLAQKTARVYRLRDPEGRERRLSPGRGR
jgi:predicted nicotinamide N-methyase